MREEKKLMMSEIRGRVDEAVYFILTDFTGLTVSQDAELRSKLREVSAEIHVVKNSLMRHVTKDLGLEQMEESLKGPTALVSGEGEITEALKVLKSFVKENQIPVMKVGALDGVFVTGSDLETISNLPSRDELIAQVVGSIGSPLQGIVGVMGQKVASLVNVIKAIENKKNEAA